MELLDDNLAESYKSPADSIKEIYKLRKDHRKAQKAINNARIALVIICFFTIISFLSLINITSDVLVLGLTLGVILIYGISAAMPPIYSKYSLSIALGLYLINLISSLFPHSMIAILGLFVKGIFIYFIVKGIIAAFKFPELDKKMQNLNIIPRKH